MSSKGEAINAGDFILLGGQMSSKHKEYQTIAQLDPRTAFVILFLDRLEDLAKKEPLALAREILFLKGQVNFMASCGELTKLAAIVGDTRKSFSGKGLKDVIREIRLKPVKSDGTALTS